MRKRLGRWLSAALLAPLISVVPSVFLPALTQSAHAVAAPNGGSACSTASIAGGGVGTAGTISGTDDCLITLTSGTNATWTPPSGVSNIWIVAAGGGGSGSRGYCSYWYGAGGGGGAVVEYQALNVSAGSTYYFTIGAGGAATGPAYACTGQTFVSEGYNGTATTFATSSGGNNLVNAAGGNGPVLANNNGGVSGNGYLGGAPTQDSAGCPTYGCWAGGGGGAAGAGSNMNGGAASTTSITGSTIYLGGGGASRNGSSYGQNGSNIPGNGGLATVGGSCTGAANTGYGGADCIAQGPNTGGAGGSGVIYIRYRMSVVQANLLLSLDAGNPQSFTSGSATWNNVAPNYLGSYNATLVNSPTYVASNGGYFTESGGSSSSSGSYFSLPTIPSSVSFATGLAISFYAKFDNSTNGWERILDVGNGSSPTPTDNIVVARNGSTNPMRENDLVLELFTDSSNSSPCTTAFMGQSACSQNEMGACGAQNSIPSSPTWTHYAVVLTGTTCYWYVNGSAVSTYTYRYGNNNQTANSTSATSYGSAYPFLPPAVNRTINYINKSEWGDPYFQGEISSLNVYNSTLSAAQVAQNYQAESTYSLLINNNNGSNSASTALTAARTSASITLPNVGSLTYGNYTFNGWNTTATSTLTPAYVSGASYTGQAGITLYANWKSVVTYSLNNGSGTAPPAVSVAASNSTTLPLNNSYTKSGYQFDGWYTNSAGSGGTWYAPGATYTPTGNVTLYAYWGTPQTVSGSTSYSFGVGTSGRTDTHTATGGTGSFTFTASGMPSGMTLDTSTINGFALVLNGTTSAATYTVTVTATDSGGVQTSQVITVYVPAVLKFTPTTQSYSTTFGVAGSIPITTTGGSTLKTISMTTLAAPVPTFVTLTSSSFSSAGTATINIAAGLPVGTYVETLTGVDGSVRATDVVTITINPLPYLTFPTTASLPTFTSGSSGPSLTYDFSNTSSYSGSGTSVTDLTANTSAGTFGSAPSFTNTSTVGGYVSISGGQNLFTGPIPTLTNTGSYSRFAWVYPTATGDIWTICDSVCSYHTTEVEYIASPAISSTSNSFVFFTYGLGKITINNCPPNQWYYVGITYDGSANLSKAYVNGAFGGSNSTGTRYVVPSGGTEKVGLGRGDTTAQLTAAAGSYYLGAFNMWRIALSAAQVAGNFEATEGKYLTQQYTSTANINTNTVSMTSGTAANFSYVTPQSGTGNYSFSQSLSAGGAYISLDTTTNPGLATIRVAAGIPASTYTSNITATDSAGVSNYPFTTNIVVNPAVSLSASPASISTTAGTAASTSITVSNGTLNSGATYSYVTAASASNSGISWNTSANPVVLNVSAQAATGTYYETLTATDSVGASTSLGITVIVAQPLSIAGSTGSSVSTTVTKATSLVLNVLNGTGARTVSFSAVSGSSCPASATQFYLVGSSPYNSLAIGAYPGTSTTTFNIGNGLAVGNYQCSLKAVDAAGAQSNTTINVAVNAWPTYISNSGLVAYYDAAVSGSYSGTGSTWTNLGSLGTAQNATLTSAPTFSTSNQGTFTFAGTASGNGSGSGNYATITNPGQLTNYTVSVWAYPTSLAPSGAPAFITEAYPGSTNINYAIWISAGQVCGGYFNTPTWHYAGGGCYAITANNWYNFSLVVSGSGSNYSEALYEGTLTSAPTLLGTVSTNQPAPLSSGNNLYIGRRWDSPDFINGQIPVVMLYNQALSLSQITQNYNEMVQRFSPSSSLVANSVTTTQGVAASITDSANLGNTGLTYSVTPTTSGVSLSSGSGTSFTLNFANTLTSTSTTSANSFTEKVIATDSSTATTSATYQVTVNPPIIITSASTTPTGTSGVVTTDAISASQGTGASTFTISPAINGITLTSTGTGTASLATSTSLSAGTYVETVTARDTVGATTQQAYTFTVNPAPTVSGPVTINCTTGSTYRSALFTAANGTGTLNFGISPALTGVSVSSASGTTFYVTVNASGPAVGTYTENVTATDSKGAVGTWQITLKVNPQVTIGNAANISINYGDSLSQTYTTSGGSGTLYFSGSGSSSSLCPVIEGTDHSNSLNTYDEIYGVGSCVWQTPTGVSSGRVLMVGGGGAGGGGIGGGGGAGEYIDNSSLPLSGAMTVTIGAGGTGVSGNQGGNGGNTTFGGVTAYGGGGGGGSGGSNGTQNGATNTYGSGGGGSYWGTGGSPSTDPTANSFSHAGGNGTNGGGGTATAGGGGGASGAGSNGNASTQSGGAGASGYQSAIDLVNYAGGGGGGFNGDANVPANRSTGSVGAGGAGGGGAGGPIPGGSGNNGTPGTGGGGGGASNGSTGGKGGSGAVVISYLTSAVTANNKMSMKVTNNQAGTGAVVLDIPAGIQAGTTVTQYLSAVDSSGTSGGSVNFTITINKAPGTVALSIPGGASSTAYGFPVTISATTNTPGTIAFAYGGTTLSGCGSVSTTNNVATCSWTPSVLNAGASLTASLTPTDTTDYTSTGVGTIANFAVVPAPAVVFTAPTQTFTYTGNPISDLPLQSPSSVSSIDRIGSVTLSYQGINGTSYGPTTTAPTNAGTYSVIVTRMTNGISASGTPDAVVPFNPANYVSFTYQAGTMTISRAALSATISYGDTVTATATYNSTAGYYSPILTTTTDVTPTYSADNTSVCGINSSSGALTTNAVGTCTVSVVFPQGTNYLGGTITRLVTINRAPRTFTLSSSASTLKYGDTATISSVITPSDNLAQTEGVITYSLAATSTCSFNSSTMVVTALSATGSCLITGNITQGDHYLSVSASAPSLTFHTAVAPVISYSAVPTINFTNAPAVFALTPTITGLKFSDALGGVTPIYTGTGSTTYAASTTAPTHGGTYSIAPSAWTLLTGSTLNYDTPTYTAVSATIAPIAQQAIVDNQSMSAASTPFQLAYTGGSTGGTATYQVTGGTASGCTINSSGILNALSQGTCIVLVTLPATRDYNAVTLSITVTVAQYVNYAAQVVVSNSNTQIGGGLANQGITSVGPAVCTSGCAPLITELDNSGGTAITSATMGDQITILGTGFTGATLIRFGRTAITNINVNSDTSITFVVPSGIALTSYQVKVQTPVGLSPAATLNITG